MKNNFLIGGDPEFPCIHSGVRDYVSLINIVEGTKKNPKPIELNGCFQQLDNVMIEFTLPPAPEFWMYKKTIDDCIQYTNNWLKTIDPYYKLDIVSSAKYQLPDLENEIAMTFGCEPSYSVYRNAISHRPDPITVGNLRSCGYHIHYGWNENYSKKELYKFLVLNDIFLGFQSIYVDSDKDRRLLYGNLSDHRIITKEPIEYEDIKESNRVEYRVLGAGIHSNAWFVEDGIKAIKTVLEEDKLDYFYNLYYNDLYNIDDSNYNEDACEILKNKLIKNNHFNKKIDIN